MDYRLLSNTIEHAIRINPLDKAPYKDMLSALHQWEAEEGGMKYRYTTHGKGWVRLPEYEDEFQACHAQNRIFRDMCAKAITLAQNADDVDWFYDMYKASLLFDSMDFFDAYLQYMELERNPQKRFYAPRRHYLKPIIEGYQQIADGNLQLLTVSMPKRSGKAVTLDTLIPTPSGFVRMGDINVGDVVIGADGQPTRVTNVFPQGKVPIYEVKFSDGATVKTCGNHLWEVKYHNVNSPSGYSGYSTIVCTTKDILEHGVKGGNGRMRHNIYAVKNCEPVEFNVQHVEIDPYVLGILIGDGSFMDNTVMFTSFDNEVPNYVMNHLPDGDVCYCQDAKRGRWVIKSAKRKIDKGGHMLPSKTMEYLNEYGLMGKYAWEKHIPEEYLYNSAEIRYMLLCGLLDTDGCCSKNLIEYATTSPTLRDQVIFLARSLGGAVNCLERMGCYKKNGKKIYTRMNYRLFIKFARGVSPFLIERKRDRYRPQRDVLYHYIESITPCGEDYAQCITVDSPDHLFLITDYFVPTHNSQCGINFVNFLSGRHPERSTLMEGVGDDLVKSFYKGCLEYLITPNEYLYYDVFPEAKLTATNADDKTINLKGRRRFPTIMCRSIDSRQVGLSEATNLLYLDDCVEGREEAKNRQRLEDKWEIISGDIMGRAIEGTPMVFCGTRYSIYDPIGKVQEYAQKMGWNWKAIEIPALDPITDESNYEYEREGKKVFTTQFFREQRELLSEEQFESEFQQQPFEAKGLVLPKKELNYFFSLPTDRSPDTVIAVCDTAEKGSDSTAMPIAAIYGTDVYIIDVVFDNSPPDITKPECANALIRNKVADACFESNNAGEYYARDVMDLCEKHGYPIGIRTKRTVSNKETRIEFASDNIKKHFYFKDPSTYERNSQYAGFMREATSHTRSGKVAHDDAIDSLSLLENEIRTIYSRTIEIFTRPF